MSGLTKRIAIVTGAAQGIGLGIARRLSLEGAAVVMADVNAEKLRQAADVLSQGGANVLAVAADVSSSSEVKRMVSAAIERFGTVHILVNNAGGSGHQAIGDIEGITDDIWHDVVGANLYGTFYCIRAVAPVMKAQRHGRIINLSSILARGAGGPLGTVGARIPYASAKSGIEGLTRQTSKDFAPYDITVNAVVPGLVMTEPGARMYERFKEIEPRMKDMVLSAFNQKPATPDEVGAMVAYLASDEAGHVTGQQIDIGVL
jgi:3-oxoacyl-[acyl-carrier protein] reductase